MLNVCILNIQKKIRFSRGNQLFSSKNSSRFQKSDKNHKQVQKPERKTSHNSQTVLNNDDEMKNYQQILQKKITKL